MKQHIYGWHGWRLWGFLSVVMVMVALCSCVSGSRMVRALPFSERNRSMPDPERINGWPLIYSNAGSTTVMWPFMDFDDKGFAIRPLLVMEEDDVSLLWPLSGWNARKGDGWLLNSYWDEDTFGIFPISRVEEDWGYFLNSYWNKDVFGIFPITHIAEDRGFFLNSYWDKDTFGIIPIAHIEGDQGYFLLTYWDKDAFGVFPVMYAGPEWGYFLNTYWGKDCWGIFPVTYIGPDNGYLLNIYWDKDAFGVFPVLRVGEDWGYVLNVYWKEECFGIFPVMYAGPDWGYFLNGYWNNRGWGIFPVSFINYDGSAGYVGPVYWDENMFGIFPIMNINDNLSYVGPVYWDENMFGVFPIMNINDNLSYVGPVYWDENMFGIFPIMNINDTLSYVGTAWWTQDSGGLFPLYHFTDKGTHLEHRLLGALGSWENAPDYHRSWLVPLWFADIDSDEYLFASLLGGSYGDSTRRGHWVFPLWWHDEMGETTTDLLPLLYRSRSPEKSHLVSPLAIYQRTETSSSLWAFPTWFSETTPTGSNQNLFPLYHRDEVGDEITSWVIPFYYHASDPTFYSLYTPLGNYNRSADSQTLNVYPLWWSSEDDVSSSQTLLPFYHYRNSDGKKSLVTPLGGHGWDETGDTRFLNVMGPLYHHQRTEDDSFELTAFAWPLYTHWRDGETTRDVVPLLYHRTATPDVLSINVLSYLCQIQLEKDSTSWMAFPFASGSNRETVPNALWHANLLYFYNYGDKQITRITPLYQRKTIGANTTSYLFPLYNSTSTPTEYDLDMMIFLGDYNTTDLGTSARLWPLAAVSRQPQRPDPLYHISLFSYHRYADRKNWWFTPLIGQNVDGGASFSWALPLAWWSSNTDGDFDLRYLLGLGNLHYDNHRFTRSSLIPLYDYTVTDDEHDFDCLFYLADYNTNDLGTSARLWPLAAVSRQPQRPDPLYYISLFSYHRYADRKNWWFTPLIGQATTADESFSWALPLAWWSSDSDGDFDLYYLMGLGNLRYDNHRFTRSSLIPLYDYTVTADEHDLDALFYLVDYNTNDLGTSTRLWPLASFSRQPQRPDPLYYISLFSYHRYADRKNWWFTPLIGQKASAGESFGWVMPVTWWTSNDTGDLDLYYLLGLGNLRYDNHRFSRSSLVPLYDYTVTADTHNVDVLVFFGNLNLSDTGTSARLWPLASFSRQPQRPDPFYYASLFSYHQYADRKNWWFTPLIGQNTTAGESVSWIVPVTWWTSNDKGDLDLRYLLGFGNLRFNDHRFSRSTLFPLFSVQRDTPSPDHPMHLVRFNYRDNGYSFGVFPLLGITEDGDDEGDRFTLSILCGLGGTYTSWANATSQGSEYNYLLLAGGKSEVFTEAVVPKTTVEKTVASSSSYVFPLYYKDKSLKRRWKTGTLTQDEMDVLSQWWVEVHKNRTSSIPDRAIVELLESKGFTVTSRSTEKLKADVTAFAKQGCFDQKDASFTSPIYWSKENAQEEHWNVLFWFVYYTLDRTTDRSTFRVMRYLYSRERQGNTVCRSFFPFFTWDTDGEASDFSFGWRIWHRKKDKYGKTSGHIFFIPW